MQYVHICVMSIAPTTYYDGEMPVVTTTNLDKMNKMRRTAREMTEAQRDSNRAPTENLVAVQKRGVGLAQGGMEFLRLQEQNAKAAEQWFAASMRVARLQQRNVRFAQEWLREGAEALREQTEHNLRTAESIVEGRGLSPSPSTCYPRIRSLSSPLRGEAWKG